MAHVEPNRLWVVGLYGCLTSWIGHALSATGNSRFIDGDEAVAELAGRSLMEFARSPKGERHDWISCYVRYVTSKPGNIVASVPACVADHLDDTHLLAHSGTLVYLRLSRELLLTYVTSDPRQHRPAREVCAWLDRVFDRRDQALTQAAHHVIDVAGGSSADARAATSAVNGRIRLLDMPYAVVAD